jgi:hypothetical protein
VKIKSAPLELRFEPPTAPASENAIRGMHWAKARRLLKPWKEAAQWAWVMTPRDIRSAVQGVACEVEVELPFATGAHRDPSNYVGSVVKAIVDGLKSEWISPGPRKPKVEVWKGIWPDDGPEWVTVREPICVKGTEVVVRLTPRT